ncbi:MAG TPA: glycosyltransferase [Pseudonocardiaceae bacterium]|jgi:UDP:flavonoid glycosyltransferase YjiC (YdhE family)
MRVLCSTTPMEGVFAPVVPITQALARQGHSVLVATAKQLLERVRSTGLTATLAGPDAPEAAARAVRDPEFAAGEQPWRIGAIMFARIMAPEKLPALQRIAADFAPELILHPSVDLAAPLLAELLGVPSITYGTGLPLEPDLIDAMAGWVAPLWEANGATPDRHAGLYRHGYLDPLPLSLATGFPPTRILPVRPTPPGSVHDPLPLWAYRLGPQPVVYVSLGTVPIFTRPEFFAPILAGLADLDVDVVATVGPDIDPTALGPAPRNVHIEQWLSLPALLMRCDAVLCHGGAGTTLAALAHGLPSVLLPRGADQFPTAAACARAGAATVIPSDAITPDAVRDAVQLILKDESYRIAAERIRDEIAAMPSPAAVAAELSG